ncbi:hypothetical protein Pfo_011934 [Paulownia fortunei]|nr:hypothetical protein Pfo_011934 [Paulownia fortunei]
MLSSITSKIHYFRLHHSPVLSHLQILLFYHTSPHKNPPVAPKPTSHPIQNHPKSNLFISPAPTHFNYSDFQPATVLETLNCYANDWKLALEFFNWVETQCRFQHTTQTLNRIIDILGKFFEFDIAWNLIERMRKNPYSLPDHTTFRVLFKRYVSAHLVKEAIDAFSKLDEYNLRDETSFSNLIDALCEHRHVIEAEELCFKKNRDNEHEDNLFGFNVESTKLHNMILRGWFKMEWWRKCRDFWEEMDKRGVRKDLYSYSIYMDIQCKSGKPWKAVKLYKEMKKKGIQLDVVAYNTVIRAIGISEGVDVAVRLYKEMIELGCKPNVATFNTILKLLCDNGRYREAHKVLNLMTEKGCEPNIVTYHCFFMCLEKPREILKVFDRMVESGILPRMDTYVMLMRKFGRWGFLRPVFLVWKKMAEHGLSPDEFAYNALIDALLQKGLVDMARKYDEEMLLKGLSAKPRAELQTKSDSEGSGNGNTEHEDGSLIQLPVNDVLMDLIVPFLFRQKGRIVLPEINDTLSTTISSATKPQSFNHDHHRHPLTLVILSDKDAAAAANDDDGEQKRKQINNNDEEEEELTLCDGCITPIVKSCTPQMYYSCDKCKFFLHLCCYELPSELEHHHKKGHKLSLSVKGVWSWSYCYFCFHNTNGLFYRCEDCQFTIDVKCASVPQVIKHAARQHHKLIGRYVNEGEVLECDACRYRISDIHWYVYSSENCGFNLHYSCAMLPASVRHRWDKHPLALSYPPYSHHPDDFYCEICEEEIHPKAWMYHCRQCDQSFHPTCLSTCGYYRNIKFGQQLVLGNCHRADHPLTYVLVTLKHRCNLCPFEVYGKDGFECASCYFACCMLCAGIDVLE